MKRPSNKRLRDALIFARKQIEDGTEEFICYALGNYLREHDSGAGLWLRWYVRDAIDPYVYLDDWQNKNGITTRNGRDDRIAWIDWMLEEL